MINNQYMPNTDELEDGPVQIEEIKKVTRGMSNNKAPGWDAIVLFHNIFFSSGEQPEQRIAAHKL